MILSLGAGVIIGVEGSKYIIKSGKTGEVLGEIAGGASIKEGTYGIIEDAIKTSNIDEIETIIKSFDLKDLSSEEIENLIKAINKSNLSSDDIKKIEKLLRNGDLSKVIESGSNSTRVDYSYKFNDELVNFNDGYEIKNVVDKDMILVQYSSYSPNASLCYWTTVDEANGIATLDEYMNKLAISKDWGNRNTVKVARIKAGTEVKHAIGIAKEQLQIVDSRPGGGVQILFNEFDTN